MGSLHGDVPRSTRYLFTMARKQKLKVYRTPIGFHDALVAATSQKEALKAWGADVDLFARGAADAVTNENLTREPMQKPGTVIRRLHGTSDEHIAALPKDKPAAKPRVTDPIEDVAPAPRRRQASTKTLIERPICSTDKSPNGATPAREAKARTRRTPPRPSRARLDKAEQALERAQDERGKEIAEIRAREKVLQRQRRDLEERHEAAVARLEAAIEKARDQYAAALEKWRI